MLGAYLYSHSGSQNSGRCLTGRRCTNLNPGAKKWRLTQILLSLLLVREAFQKVAGKFFKVHNRKTKHKYLYQMFGYFGAADVDVVADCFNLLETGFQNAQLARQVTLAITAKEIEGRVNVLKNEFHI